jgi:hypothetical protein
MGIAETFVIFNGVGASFKNLVVISLKSVALNFGPLRLDRAWCCGFLWFIFANTGITSVVLSEVGFETLTAKWLS